MQVEAFVVSPVMSNCYVVSLPPEQGSLAVVIDPGDIRLEKVMDYITQHDLQVHAVWCTHAHFDHVMGVDVIRNQYGVPAYVHQADELLWREISESARSWIRVDVPSLEPPDAYFEDGQVISLGRHEFTIWHTPGHSPGSVCFIGSTIAFTGDTIFASSIGRTDLPYANGTDMEASLRRLLRLSDHLTLYPGHMARTTMDRERKTNPFLVGME
jgi:hydroxyacylglutathione hydrolase